MEKMLFKVDTEINDSFTISAYTKQQVEKLMAKMLINVDKITMLDVSRGKADIDIPSLPVHNFECVCVFISVTGMENTVVRNIGVECSDDSIDQEEELAEEILGFISTWARVEIMNRADKTGVRITVNDKYMTTVGEI